MKTNGFSLFLILFFAKSVLAVEPQFSYDPSLPYLGDGTHTYHYFPIFDHLLRNKGSKEITLETSTYEMNAKKKNREIEEHNKSAKNKRNDWLKPPSASILESEFSHLLKAIANDNGLMSAAIYDSFGLLKGASAINNWPIVLGSKLQKEIAKQSSKSKPFVLHCSRFKSYDISIDQNCTKQFAIFLSITTQEDKKTIGFSGAIVDEKYYMKPSKF